MEPVDQEEPPSELKDPKEWQWLSPLVLQLIERKGDQVAAEVAHLVGDWSGRVTAEDEGPRVREDYTLNRARIETLFGIQTTAVLQFLTQGPSDPWYVVAAREQAAQLLKNEAPKVE